jgi:hypothetical protein
MKEGDKVIIKFNPHHNGADRIVGTVKSMEPRPGGLRVCDLAYVEYENPHDGRVYVLPFGLNNLQPTSYQSLIDLAEFHENLATQYRELAEQAKE